MDFASAIARIESGGRYDLLGPITRSGDRAYGKYQVMGANIPEWTQRVLGQPMTPEQFLANPQAQDQVFENIFGGYVRKHGPGGAARAWFAGEGGMNDPNRKDILGTSVADYERKFLGQAPQGGPVAQPVADGPFPQSPGLLGESQPPAPNVNFGALAGLLNSAPQQLSPPPPMPILPRRKVDLSRLQSMLRS